MIKATSCLAKIKSNDEVGCNDDANSNNGVGRSGEHAQVSVVLMAICCSARIKSNDKVDNCCEANSNNRHERSGAHAQF